MPFTGLYTRIIHRDLKIYSARLEDPKARWVAVPHGFSDGAHVDFKPKLVVEIAYLKNFNTPPMKFRRNGKILARSWVQHVLIPAETAKNLGFDVDLESAGPKPGGKGWKKGLEEVF